MIFNILKKLFPPLPASSPAPDKYHVFTDKYDKEIPADAIDLHIGTADIPSWNKAREQYRSFADTRKQNALREWENTIFKLRANTQFDGSKIAVSILIDHSGSMKGDKAFLCCALAEVLADSFFKLAIQYEILGFTTSSWRGGQSRKEWICLGYRPNPGRLCDLLHIIYQPFSEDQAGAGKGIHNIFRDELLKENVDGEALLWAAKRFPKTDVDKRILIVVSDGAPVDDSTLSCNPHDILQKHLQEVVTELAAQNITLASIGIEYETSCFYPNSYTLKSSDPLEKKLTNFIADLVTA